MFIEKIKMLMEISPDELDSIVDYSRAITDYVNVAAMHEIQNQMLRIKSVAGFLDQQDFIDGLEGLNRNRNYAHDRACEACHNLNELARRCGQRKIFDFDLEPMKNQRGISGFSQDNHRKVSRFCGQFMNEFYEKGRVELRDNMIDTIIQNAQVEPYHKLDKSFLMDAISDRIHSDKENELEAFLDEGRKGVIKCRDGITIQLKNNRDDMADVMIENKEGEAPELGDAVWYFTEKEGYDIPCSVIREIVELHGGALEIAEQEKTMLEKVIDGDEIAFCDTEGPEAGSWER